MIFFVYTGNANLNVFNPVARNVAKLHFNHLDHSLTIGLLENDKRPYEKIGGLPCFKNNSVARIFINTSVEIYPTAGLRIAIASQFSTTAVVNGEALGVLFVESNVIAEAQTQASVSLIAHAYAFVNANIIIPEKSIRNIVKEEIFLTPTNALASYAQLNNYALYLNSLFGVIAQSVHKTEISNNRLKIYDHTGSQVYFERNISFDQNILPVKTVD